MPKAAKAAVVEDEIASPRAVTRLLGVFEAIARHSGAMSLAELSAALASPKSSLLVMLRQLVTRGYLQHADGRYRLGPGMYRLAADVLRHRHFPAIVRAQMAALAEASGETVILAAIDREAGVATYVDTVESRQPVRYVVPVGMARPLYCSSAGLCLLAWQEPAWRDDYLRTAVLAPMTPLTMTDARALARRLADIRRDGVAVSVGEAVPDAAGAAAPIVEADGAVRTALLVGAPVLRFKAERATLESLVRDAAATVSAAMGAARD